MSGRAEVLMCSVELASRGMDFGDETQAGPLQLDHCPELEFLLRRAVASY